MAGLALASGCSSGKPETSVAERRAGSDRVERCVERFVERATAIGNAGDQPGLRAYARRAYCEPFDARGWVHDDGALTIEAFTQSGQAECATEQTGEPARTVPCESLEPADVRPVFDCGLLHLVRRDDVRAYVDRLPQRPQCDDGTPVEELGVE